MQIRCKGQKKRAAWKSRLKVCKPQARSMFFFLFLIQKTSLLAWGFNFVRIHLKRSVKVRKFSRVFAVIFFFDGIFGGEENVLGDCYTKAGWMAQNKVRKSVWRAFDVWQGRFLGLKKLLTTKISNSKFISSSRWETVRNLSSRWQPIRSNQNEQCAVHHSEC